MSDECPQRVQEAQYHFPYHHLPHENDGVWYVGRHLQWGFEYLFLLETVLEMAMELNPASILDFGCGDGRLLFELAKRSRGKELELWGVDVDERALLFARAFNRGESVNFARNVGELSGRKFELLVASEVLEHIPPEECPDLVSSLADLLADAGIFLVTVPTWNIPRSRKHFRHFRLHELEALLAEHFTLVSHRYLHRTSTTGKLLRGLAANRLFVANWVPWLKGLHAAFRKWVAPAVETDGTRLVAVFSRRRKNA